MDQIGRKCICLLERTNWDAFVTVECLNPSLCCANLKREKNNMRDSNYHASQDFKECVAVQAQYIYDIYGKFPATVPSIFAFMYLQAHHLDLSFYDHYFKPGAYLATHAEHMKTWH